MLLVPLYSDEVTRGFSCQKSIKTVSERITAKFNTRNPVFSRSLSGGNPQQSKPDGCLLGGDERRLKKNKKKGSIHWTYVCVVGRKCLCQMNYNNQLCSAPSQRGLFFESSSPPQTPAWRFGCTISHWTRTHFTQDWTHWRVRERKRNREEMSRHFCLKKNKQQQQASSGNDGAGK